MTRKQLTSCLLPKEIPNTATQQNKNQTTQDRKTFQSMSFPSRNSTLVSGGPASHHELDYGEDRDTSNKLHYYLSKEATITETAFTFIQEKLTNALDTISKQASIIKSLNDEIIHQHQVVDNIDEENEELISDMQDLMQENEIIIKKLHSAEKEISQLDESNIQLISEIISLMDKLEKKRLGWLEKSEVEELKWQIKKPLIWKLEARREEIMVLEERVRSLDAERDGLAEQLAKAMDRISELSSTNVAQILQVSKPQINRWSVDGGRRKSLLEMIPSIPGFFHTMSPPKTEDLISTSTQNQHNLRRTSDIGLVTATQSLRPMTVEPQAKLQRSCTLSNSRWQAFSVHSNHGSNMTQIPTKPSSNIYDPVNQAQQLFVAGGLEYNSHGEEQHKSILRGEAGENSRRSDLKKVNAAKDMNDLGALSDFSSDKDMQNDKKVKLTSPLPDVDQANYSSKPIKVDDFGYDEDDSPMRRNNVADAVHSINQISSALKEGGAKVHCSNAGPLENVVSVQEIVPTDMGDKRAEKLDNLAKLGHAETKRTAESLVFPYGMLAIVNSRAADFRSVLSTNTMGNGRKEPQDFSADRRSLSLHKSVSQPGLAATKTIYSIPRTLPNSSKPHGDKINRDLSISQLQLVKSIVAKSATAFCNISTSNDMLIPL